MTNAYKYRAYVAQPDRIAKSPYIPNVPMIPLTLDEVRQNVLPRPTRATLGLPRIVVRGVSSDVTQEIYAATPTENLSTNI